MSEAAVRKGLADDIPIAELPDPEEMPERYIEYGTIYHLSNGMKITSVGGGMYADPEEYDFYSGDIEEATAEFLADDGPSHEGIPVHGVDVHFAHGVTDEGKAVVARMENVIVIEKYHTPRLLNGEREIRSALHNRLNDVRRRNEEAALKAMFDGEEGTEQK